MGCGEFLVKYILFFANLFFALAGLTLLAIGVVVQLQVADLSNVVDASLQAAPITAMVVGSIVFLIAFFGCCGAIRESNCMLVSFAICMLVLMIAKIALATVLFVAMDDVINAVPNWLNESFNRDKESFHVVESTFKCCGPTGPLSYMNVSLPDSCCATSPCIVAVNTYPGCSGVVSDFLHTFGLVIGIVAIVIGAIELVAAVFGLCLANHVRNKYRRSRY